MPNDPVLAAAVQRASAAVAQTAASPNNAMSVPAVAEAAPELRANIEAAIAPVIQNATNTEPHFWMKRTFWSWFAATAAGSVAALGVIIDYLQHHTFLRADGSINWIVIGFAIWSGRAAYRAGVATTPLGTPAVPHNPVSYRG